MTATPGTSSADPWQIISELRRERDQALAQQAATAEVLQVKTLLQQLASTAD